MKKLFYVVLCVLTLSIVLYCSDENSFNNNSTAPTKKISNKTTAREAGDFNFTKGGDLNLTSAEISSLYQLCSNETDYSNIKRVLLYTAGNENGEQPINVDKLRGISFYKYRNGFLEHSFYKNNNGIFEKVDDLTLNTSTKLPMQDIDFIIRYSSLTTNQLTVYSSLNPAYSNLSLQDSNEFKDFLAWDFGSHVKLQKTMLDVENRIAPQGKCGKCTENTTGDCQWDLSPENGGWCDPKIEVSCRFSFIKSLLSVNPKYNVLFNQTKAYEVRDQLLSKSLFGQKYQAYYYLTSFGTIDFDFNDSVELASLLPEIYKAYDTYQNNNIEQIVITNDFAAQLISVIDKMKAKNTDKKYFVKILDDIADDINFIKNKNVGEIKSKIF
ncbi:MAG TPA: hypothetical protein DCQ50_18565 [Chryseobacterium sp.]|nr:hypothetical protein [Chryseobacterium sp.]